MAKRGAAASRNGRDKLALWNKQTAKAKKTWKSSRKAKGGRFEDVEIEDGTYHARLSKGTASISAKSKVPYVVTKFVILQGDYEATTVRRQDFLQDDDAERQSMKQESFAKAMDGCGYDVSELDLSEVPQLVDDLNEDRPYVEIGIVNWQSDTNHGYNCYVNRLLTDEEIAELGDGTTEDVDDDEDLPAENVDKPTRSRTAKKKKTATKKKAAPRKKARARA